MITSKLERSPLQANPLFVVFGKEGAHVPRLRQRQVVTDLDRQRHQAVPPTARVGLIVFEIRKVAGTLKCLDSFAISRELGSFERMEQVGAAFPHITVHPPELPE